MDSKVALWCLASCAAGRLPKCWVAARLDCCDVGRWFWPQQTFSGWLNPGFSEVGHKRRPSKHVKADEEFLWAERCMINETKWPPTKGVVVCFDSLTGVFGELCNTPVSATTKETFLSETRLKKWLILRHGCSFWCYWTVVNNYDCRVVVFFFLPYSVLKRAASALDLRSCSNKSDSSRSVPRAVPLNQYLVSQAGR